MKKLLLAGLLLAGAGISAQTSPSQDSLVSASSKFFVSSNGLIGQWESLGSTEASLMYGQHLWISAFNGDSIHSSSMTYREGYIPGPITTDTNALARYDRVWKIRRSQIDSVQQGLYDTLPDVVANWPAHGDTTFGEPYYLAPYVDANNNDFYDPENGDFPAVPGDEAIFFMFNDKDSAAEAKHLQVEIHGVAYHHSNIGGAMDSTFLVDYKIINRSDNTYTEAWLSSWNDFDLGHPTDDLVGTDINSNSVIGYNSVSPDHDFGHTLASAGVFLVKGPPANYFNNVDDDRDGCVDGIRDKNGNCIGEDASSGIREHHVMSASSSYNPKAAIFPGMSASLTAPENPLEERNYILGFCKDGTRLEIDSNNTIWDQNISIKSCSLSDSLPFMFTGPSFDSTGSVEPSKALDWHESPAEASDKRALLSSGPFTLQPGQAIGFRIGFRWHLADSATSSQNGGYFDLIKTLRGADSAVANADTSGSGSTGSGGGGGGTFGIKFNKPAPDFQLHYVPQDRQYFVLSSNRHLNLRLYSLQGKLMKKITIAPHERMPLNLDHLPRGIYILADPQSGNSFKIMQ